MLFIFNLSGQFPPLEVFTVTLGYYLCLSVHYKRYYVSDRLNTTVPVCTVRAKPCQAAEAVLVVTT